MTGKEVLIGLVGAGLVGGAAGASASFVAAPKAENVAAQTSPEVLQRLKSTEEELAKAVAALEASRKSIDSLQERVTSAELLTAKHAADAAATSASRKPEARAVRLTRHKDHGETGKSECEEIDIASELKGALGAIDFGAVQIDGEEMGVQLGKALEGLGADLPGAAADFAGFRAGLDLRKLPEAERWQKAKDELGLTWNQVEDLKKAVGDREAALKEATTTEKKTAPNGGQITIERPDEGKTARAQADYHDKLDKTLNEDQKKSWRSKGYDQAFGGGPFGMARGAMMMTFDVATDKAGDVPKDAPK